MARIKGATMTHKRRAKTLKLAKGYYGAKSKHFRMDITDETHFILYKKKNKNLTFSFYITSQVSKD